MRKTLPSCIAMVLALLTTLPLQAQVKDRAYYENLSIYYAYGANQAGEDPLYGGGHGLVIRASVSPTWTSTSLAGSGITASNDYPDPNPDVFGLSTPYRAIFKDDYCNRTGYLPMTPPRVCIWAASSLSVQAAWKKTCISPYCGLVRQMPVFMTQTGPDADLNMWI